jgi:predicted esterase
MRRLRILCLHGYHGHARMLQSHMAPLTKGLELFAEFVCVDAPSLSTGGFGWWHAVSTEGRNRKHIGVAGSARRYEGWTKTKDWMISLFEQSAPFDGVFGFSQGATLTSLLVGLRNHRTEGGISFDFAIMVGGFASNDGSHADLYQRKSQYDLPSVHIIGKSDLIVPSSHSEHLAGFFKAPLMLRHSGGHVIPSDPLVRNGVTTFLQERARDSDLAH